MGAEHSHSKVFFHDGIGNGCQECWKCTECKELGCDSEKWGLSVLTIEEALDAKRVREVDKLERHNRELVSLDRPFGTEHENDE